MKKIKCKVCGKRFPADKRDRYLASEHPAMFKALVDTTQVFECFDCPNCGCQSAVNIRLSPIKEDSSDE